MKKLLATVGVIFAIGLLSGCEKRTTEYTSNYVLPSGLEDCKIFNLNSGFSNITAVRCPLSSTTTTYSTGKTTHSVSVVEGTIELNGEMYKKVPK